MVERQWRAACKTENESSNEDPVKYTALPVLPNDSEIAAAFMERKKRLAHYYPPLFSLHILAY